MPLALCYGTRPQIIKVSALAAALGARWPLLTIDTGQHYDYELNAIFYAQLGVRPATLYLDVGSGSHATQTAAVLTRAADAIAQHRPRAVVVVGDTNSTVGCALAAAQLRVSVIHVEAGLRAADRMMGEDLNRRLTDTLSAVLCAPSAAAEAQLRREALPGTIVRTGDVAYDVLRQHIARAPDADARTDWPLPAHEPFVLATLHRAELTADPVTLHAVLTALSKLPLPVVLPAHPRTRALLDDGLLRDVPRRALHVVPPLGYLEMLAAVRDARLVATDSGGVQREAYWLGTPCVTVRNETEWTETLALGANVLVPPRAARELLPALAEARLGVARGSWDRGAYGDGDAASRIADAVAVHLVPT